MVREYPFPEKQDGGSMYGLAVSPDGATIYFTGQDKNLYSGTLDDAGALAVGPTVDLTVDKLAAPNPLGVALTPDAKLALVALAVANQVAVVDLALNKVIAHIPVGVCPYSVAVSPDGQTAFVSNFGGSRARPGDKTEVSAGTDVAVDARSVALRGTVSVIDLKRKKAVAEIVTGIHPEALTLSPDGKRLYVVDASGDGIAVIDVAGRKLVAQLDTKPQADLPYGSLTTGVAVSADGQILFAANAGNNAVRCRLNPGAARRTARRLYPGGELSGRWRCGTRRCSIGNVLGYYGIREGHAARHAQKLGPMSGVARAGFHLPTLFARKPGAVRSSSPSRCRTPRRAFARQACGLYHQGE